jgi:hypothetical protein
VFNEFYRVAFRIILSVTMVVPFADAIAQDPAGKESSNRARKQVNLSLPRSQPNAGCFFRRSPNLAAVLCGCWPPPRRLRSWNGRTSPNDLNTTLTPHNIIHGDACFAYFNKV